VRLLEETVCPAASWPHARRVIRKAEALAPGINTRGVVTTRDDPPDALNAWYTARGETENRIKDRTTACFAARRGSGTWAKAAAPLADTTDGAATRGVAAITGSFAVGQRADHPSILAKQPRLRDPSHVLPHKPAIDTLWADRSAVQLVEFNQLIAREARRLLRASLGDGRGLKLMDAIHPATASLMRVADCHTTDNRLQAWSNDLGFPIRDPWTETPKLGI